MLQDTALPAVLQPGAPQGFSAMLMQPALVLPTTAVLLFLTSKQMLSKPGKSV